MKSDATSATSFLSLSYNLFETIALTTNIVAIRVLKLTLKMKSGAHNHTFCWT